jgi:uncharacterized protein (TIGR02265 family)
MQNMLVLNCCLRMGLTYKMLQCKALRKSTCFAASLDLGLQYGRDRLEKKDAMPLSKFVPFDSSSPLFIEERLRAIPVGSGIRGMFFQPLVEEAQRVQPSFVKTYATLASYPMSEFLLVVVQVADIVYPELPRQEALRRLGRLHLQAFTKHTVGRVLFASTGGFIETALSLLPRVYELLASGVTAKLLELNSSSAIISFRGFWGFPECYQVGVFESVFEAFQVEGDILVRKHSLSDVDISLSWRRKKP